MVSNIKRSVAIFVTLLAPPSFGFLPRSVNLQKQKTNSQQAGEWVRSPKLSKISSLRDDKSYDSGKQLTVADRKLIAGISSIGVVETAWINAQKFGLYVPSTDGLCTGGAVTCSQILNGPWSEVFGVPLSLPGMLAYVAVLALALIPVIFNSSSYDMSTRTQKGLLALTTGMACFSGYLVSVLAFKIGSPCPWCFVSASLCVVLCGLTWSKTGSAQDLKLGISSATATGLASLVVYVACTTEIAIADAQAFLDSPSETSQKFSPPPITKRSSERGMQVAALLKSKNTRFYGAYWCSHCYDQKQLLGLEAMQQLPYIECAKDGENSQRKLCQQKNIPGYPTWEVDGKLYPGETSLDELENIALGRSERTPP